MHFVECRSPISYSIPQAYSITTPRCGWIEFKFGACIYHYLNLCLLSFGDLPCIGYVI